MLFDLTLDFSSFRKNVSICAFRTGELISLSVNKKYMWFLGSGKKSIYSPGLEDLMYYSYYVNASDMVSFTCSEDVYVRDVNMHELVTSIHYAEESLPHSKYIRLYMDSDSKLKFELIQ